MTASDVVPATTDERGRDDAPTKWSADQLDRMRRFASGRVTAERFADPWTDFSEVWAPKVAGMYVRVAGQHQGYKERADALAAGRRYREACRTELGAAGVGGAKPSTATVGPASDTHPNPSSGQDGEVKP